MTDPHQPATSPGTDPADVERRAQISQSLGKEVWPADRDALLAKAQEANAPDNVVSALRRLPAGTRFTNVQEVAEALGMGTEQHRF
ncbi:MULTISPECIES: DUF2795 domain-containing protein [unclassified Modestobacter]